MPGGCECLDEEQQASSEPWQHWVSLGFRASLIWDFTIFGSGWGGTIPNRPSTQPGDSPGFTTFAWGAGDNCGCEDIYAPVGPFPNHEILVTVTQTLVTSQMDYYNMLFVGLPLKLQLGQNAVAQAIMCASSRTYVTPLLRELHWFPVCFEVQFKMLVLTCKALHVMVGFK